jgi:hypothetical protein
MRGTVALGDCLADVAVLRADPDICGLCNALKPEPRLVRHCRPGLRVHRLRRDALTQHA